LSYDLAVWYEPSGITAAQAARTYAQLVEGEFGTAANPAEPRIQAFHRELTARYPETHSLPADEGSPWSVQLTVTNTAVLMAMVWSRVAEVDPYVRTLADQHGLVLFDPQRQAIHHPEVMRTAPALVLSTCDGSQADNPDSNTIEQVLGTVSQDNWFAVLERGDTYVQVGYGEQAATRPGWYALERREGAADRHFRVEVADLGEIIAAFTGFARQENAWRQRLTWRRVEL
jgi:hypothetical protein